MGYEVSDSLGGAFPNKVPATLEIRACSVTQVHPCREVDLSIAVSTVTGRFMLKLDLTTRTIIIKLYGSGFSSSRGCRGGELGGIVNYYNFLLYNAAATSAALLLYASYKLLADSYLMLQDIVGSC